MSCDRHRPLLALLVGNDLDQREASDVRKHLGDCASCQAHWDELQASTGVLHSVARDTSRPASGSLWPKISSELAARPVKLPDAAPSWFTLGAFAAACAAVVWLTLSTPVFDFDGGKAGLATDEGPREVVQPVSSRFPGLHNVDNAQAPVQVFPDGEVPQRLLTPPSSFSDPRSF